MRSRVVWSTIALVAIVGVAWGSFAAGVIQGERNPKTVIVRGVSNIDNGSEDADFGLFWQAWDLLREKYITGDTISSQDLVYGAIEGLFSAVGDPNTVFLSPTEAKKFGEDISGEFSGIGAEIGKKNEQLVVIAPLKGSPAEKAGLKPGDAILKINNEITLGISIEEAVTRIRGQKGTVVTLSILRDGWSSPRDIEITRDTIRVPTVDFKMLDRAGKENAAGPIAYYHLYNFYERAPYEFSRSLLQGLVKNPKGVILDLRGNPGGYLDAGINIASLFLEPGIVVVREEMRGGETQEFKSRGSGALKEMPIVVLINEGSASASEIVAGALRDNRNIKLVGKKSFGKGTVQEVEDLPNGSLAKITIARWLTPKGHLIDKNGLTPDVAVERTEDDVKNNKDPQLEKAVETLLAQISR